MKQVTTLSGKLGPFASVEDSADGLLCDGVLYPFTVIGQSPVVANWDGPIPGPLVALPTVDEYTQALTEMLDAAAQARRYDNRITCALRAGYPGPFNAEGTAFAQWMDSCNALAYQMMHDVQMGTRPQPSMSEFLAAFPAMVWPV